MMTGRNSAASLPRTLVLGVAAGTLLNPLNSSMIAVALLTLSNDFRVDVGTATWLVSGFYLGGAFGMPLMGRLADRFGPRRIFNLGLIVVTLSALLAVRAPAFGWLLALRVVQAIGSSAPFPAGLAMFRRRDPHGRPPAGALGAVSVANSVSAAFGPVLGGGLVAIASWPAIFLVNVPFALAGLLLSWLWLPSDAAPSASAGRSRQSRSVAYLLSRGPLLNVYTQFAAVNLVFYSVFFGFPLWLEGVLAYTPDRTGLIILPVAGVGVLATPVAARLITTYGPKPALVIGSILMLAGSFLLLLFDAATPLGVLVAVGAVLGVPNGFNNLGLQAVLYQLAPPTHIGAAGGVLQTFRYIGAIGATLIIGAVFGSAVSSAGLHRLAIIMCVISALVVVASARTSDKAQVS